MTSASQTRYGSAPRCAKRQGSRRWPASYQWSRRRRTASRGPAGTSTSLLEAFLAGLPVHVLEEGVHVLGPLEGLVVAHEGVLPAVERQDGRVAGGDAVLVERDPVVGEPAGRGVLEENDPADARHAGDGPEVRGPGGKAAEGGLDGPAQLAAGRRFDLGAPLEVGEVVLVVHHAAVLEAQ